MSFWDRVPALPPADDLERDRRWSVSNNKRMKPCVGLVQMLFLTVVWSLNLLSVKMQQYAANSPPATAEPDTVFYKTPPPSPSVSENAFEEEELSTPRPTLVFV